MSDAGKAPDGAKSAPQVGDVVGSVRADRGAVGRKTLSMLKVIAANPRCPANGDDHEPITRYCDDLPGKETDTFNLAIDAGLVGFSHDSDSGDSWCYLTPAGEAALSEAKPTPAKESAPAASSSSSTVTSAPTRSPTTTQEDQEEGR